MLQFADRIVGKRVLVFGVGRQGGGRGDAQWLGEHGAIVRLSDANTSLVAEGQTQAQIDWADIIIKNPGVADDHPLLRYAHSLHKPVETSLALVVRSGARRTIAITGTRGKSTTTNLIYAMLDHAYPGQIALGGNIPGYSGLALLDQIGHKKYLVLELSSFQLHAFHDLAVSPHISLITNLYPDHLNRYEDMASYAHDKEAIVAYQNPDDYTLVNGDNEGALALGRASSGQVIHYFRTQVQDWISPLPGEHNRENLAGAWALAQLLGLGEDSCRAVVRNFASLPGRQELTRVVGGVRYINDTTATTPTAAIKALHALTGPTIWIVGGDSKNLPYSELLGEVAHNPHITQIIILGSRNIPDFIHELRTIVGGKILAQVDSMAHAVALAEGSATPGSTVLLSPGFASFDLFQNEFDRGAQFVASVAKL